MIYAIDFDGVIHDHKHPKPGRRMGEPIEGALENLTELFNGGHEIVVYTTRATAGPDHVESWLDYYGFPPFVVTAEKPQADLYLDDKAVRFTSWVQAMSDIDYYSREDDALH